MDSTESNSKEKKDAKEVQAKQKPINLFEKHKRQVAAYLGKQSERLSTLQRKGMLLTFGVVMCGLCLLMMIKPFQQGDSSDFSFPEGMESSVIISEPFSEEPILTPEDYHMLKMFKTTLDSLYKSDRPMYEELLKGRKGLLDSINFLMRLVN